MGLGLFCFLANQVCPLPILVHPQASSCFPASLLPCRCQGYHCVGRIHSYAIWGIWQNRKRKFRQASHPLPWETVLYYKAELSSSKRPSQSLLSGSFSISTFLLPDELKTVFNWLKKSQNQLNKKPKDLPRKKVLYYIGSLLTHEGRNK